MGRSSHNARRTREPCERKVRIDNDDRDVLKPAPLPRESSGRAAIAMPRIRSNSSTCMLLPNCFSGAVNHWCIYRH